MTNLLDWHTYISVAGLNTLLAATVAMLVLSIAGRLLTAALRRIGKNFLFTRELTAHIGKPVRVLLPSRSGRPA